jgi:hypothetical protein
MVGFAETGMELQIWEAEAIVNPMRRQWLPIVEILAKMPMCWQNVVSSS